MRNRRPSTAAPWVAATVPWIMGLYSVYFVSAQYTGLGLFDSYQAFQGGSNTGNAVLFVLWTAISFTACWFLAKKINEGLGTTRKVSLLLYCYAIPALLLFLPDAAMGFAVSHVKVFTDATAQHSAIAEFCIFSGAAALLCALILSFISSVRLKGARR